jgi:hypothetical protein
MQYRWAQPRASRMNDAGRKMNAVPKPASLIQGPIRESELLPDLASGEHLSPL